MKLWETPQELPPKVRALMGQAVQSGLCSGAALGVVLPDGRWHGGWWGRTRAVAAEPNDGGTGGYRPDSGAPVGPNTRFDLASLTKPLATVTLLARALSGPSPRLTLEDRLRDHLPQSDGHALGAARIFELMGHGSGAIAWRDYFQGTGGSFQGTGDESRRATDRASALRELVLLEPLRAPAGTEAVYSDLGFMALGWMLEHRLGLPLDRLFERDVAGPLGLSRTGFRRLSHAASERAVRTTAGICATEIWPPRCPQGRALQGEVHDDNAAALDGVAGHAGLFSDLSDVLRWAGCWLRLSRGQAVPASGIDPNLVRRLLSEKAAPGTTWHLGWDSPSTGISSAGRRVSRSAFGHLGFTGTSVWIDPVRAAAVVLLTNRVHPSREPHAPIKALRPAVHDALWTWLDATGAANAEIPGDPAD